MLKRWDSPNGYRDVFAISLPMVASMGSLTLMHFTDRVFLANYSVDTIAASMPAGIASFALVSFFLGVAGYTNTFVAQYTGSGAYNRLGAALWQAVYFSLASGVLLGIAAALAGPLFDLVGHPPEVRKLEIVYFQILTLGSIFLLLEWTLACFYSGRGLTRTVMAVNAVGAALNIPLDYALINGVWGFPEMGIAGAGIATVAGQALMFLLYVRLIFTQKHDAAFGVWRNRSFDGKLFLRLMKFGIPKGIQFFMDVFAFTFFVFMIGRLGTVELAATNIVFAINTLAFMPMIGFSIGVSTLVGQAIGARKPEAGEEAATSTIHITTAYMAFVALLFLLIPETLLRPFVSGGRDQAEMSTLVRLGVALLRFVALYCVLDAMNLVYAGALQGAGDTRFVMEASAVLSLGVMIIPVFICIRFLDAGLYAAWAFATAYAFALALIFWWRYRQGQWKQMRVIE
ncbi:MAG: MATE family efflux transporter [Deltaproteobacteria bacterium]|nr:MATE family efflux transporter [Deltaproteobacteria bacterium]